MEQKLDRRVRRTREQLKRALTQLLLEKPVRAPFTHTIPICTICWSRWKTS